jgi:hypothetical protein
MPPELIVTSAQAQMTDVDTNEKVQEKQAESTVTKEAEHEQTEKIRQHKSRQMSVGYVVCLPVREPYAVLPMKIREGGDKVVTAYCSNGTVYTFTYCALFVYLDKGGKGQSKWKVRMNC